MNTDSNRPLNHHHFSAAMAAAAGIITLLAVSGARAQAVEVEVVRSDTASILLEYRISDFYLEPADVDGAEHSVVVVGEAPRKERGAPELPTVTRSVMIPRGERMRARVVETEYEEIDGVRIAPSKGILSRQVDPGSVPFEFGPAYGRNDFFPSRVLETGEPYILRDARGLVVDVSPFQYNPVSRVLRVHRRILVELEADGPGEINTLPRDAAHPSVEFAKIYRHHFVNGDAPPKPALYPDVTEAGEMLVICHDAWLSNIAPFVSHKISMGIPTNAVGVSTVGNTSSQIADYIQSAYDTSDLAFVLLVGDASQVATPSSSGGSSDPSYAKVAGSDDYPDILVGRFSAETAGDVDTQVARTIAYETTPATTQTWFRKGVGIGSDEGPGDDGEMDWEHVDNIRTDLISYGYTEIDQIYDPGASAGDVSSALNDGRGIINYCGHGSSSSWGTTGFSVSDVNALTNDGMLPFIFSVACVNGNFSSGTCFGEAWLRASNGSAPAGAIAIYASSINQSWDPPMVAQDESNDLLVAEAHFSFGALAFAGSCQMIDEFGSGGVEMYDTWHVFGDPSVRVYGTSGPVTGITVSPMAGQVFSGEAGGPFSPEEATYTVTNLGEDPIDFEVSASETWLTVDPASGTLAAGASADVLVSLTSDAATYANGNHEAEVTFLDTTDAMSTARIMTLDVGIPELQQSWPLDEDPGFETEGGWAFGAPQGSGGEMGPPDPTSGHTGENVYGYNLAGDYPANMSEEHLTSTPFDCSDLTETSLRFWRWLGVEEPQWDHASLEVSTSEYIWTTVWENSAEVSDSGWTEVEYDISALADGEPEVRIRWTMGTSDQAYQFCGWNIDDIEIWGVGEIDCVDADGDGFLPLYCGGEDCDDNDDLVHPDRPEDCDDEIDNDCDDLIDMEDPDCDEDTDTDTDSETGGDSDTDTDSDTAVGERFSPGDSGCGCAVTGSSRGSFLGILAALL